MSTQSAFGFDDSLAAGADLSSKQFYTCKQTAADTGGLCSAVTDVAFGILQNEPASGQRALFRVLGTSKAIVDGNAAAIAAGDKLGPNTSGKLVKVTTADRPIAAIAKEAATTDGAIVEVLLTPGAFYRTPA
jgi:hypothetical protein